MTEETIKNTLTETRKQVLSAESHYEIAAKQILEQHEAEMVLLLEFVRKMKPTQNLMANQVGKWVIEFNDESNLATSTDLLTIFKNRNK